MFSISLIYIVITVISTIYIGWKYTYWFRKGVKGPLGFPIVGNMLSYLMARKHYGDVYEDIYKYL